MCLIFSRLTFLRLGYLKKPWVCCYTKTETRDPMQNSWRKLVTTVTVAMVVTIAMMKKKNWIKHCAVEIDESIWCQIVNDIRFKWKISNFKDFYHTLGTICDEYMFCTVRFAWSWYLKKHVDLWPKDEIIFVFIVCMMKWSHCCLSVIYCLKVLLLMICKCLYSSFVIVNRIK